MDTLALDAIHREGAFLGAAMESKAPTHDRLRQREGLSNNRVNLPKAALAAPPAAFAAYAECSPEHRGNDVFVGRIAGWRADVGA